MLNGILGQTAFSDDASTRTGQLYPETVASLFSLFMMWVATRAKPFVWLLLVSTHAVAKPSDTGRFWQRFAGAAWTAWTTWLMSSSCSPCAAKLNRTRQVLHPD